jgi:4a-hydroxytetrahydrobiopterin dehydratase
MSELAKKKCIPCSGEIPPLSEKEIQSFLKQLNGWSANKNNNGFFILEKNYKFKNFEGSLNFINQVSKVAEDENHHPDLKFGWGYANIIIFTHAVKGLTESDFVLAAKIDQLSV